MRSGTDVSENSAGMTNDKVWDGVDDWFICIAVSLQYHIDKSERAIHFIG